MGSYFRFLVIGIVQGVGFRPYIYRKAVTLGLKGYVRNIGHGVEIVVDDEDFIGRLDDLPPLARIDSYNSKVYDPDGLGADALFDCFEDFRILESSIDMNNAKHETIIPADIFMCDDCKKELESKSGRRSDYYFITCTSCGPRFSMIEDYPYDRPLTSMKDFSMCDTCRKEYTDPSDRRYHAQTIACKDCGPKLKLLHIGHDSVQNNSQGNIRNITGPNDSSTIKSAVDILKSGGVVAIKGVGGFHLCSKVSSVLKIRTILGRADKPFALMVKDLSMLEGLAQMDEYEKRLLLSPQRPIVALKKIDRQDFMDVSELDTIGIMLAYTSLHHMLFNYIDEPLVMTSCNIPGEPVIIDDNSLLEKNIGEYILTCQKSEISEHDQKMLHITRSLHFLTHERRIVNRCDDSVLKVVDNRTLFLRRSRGYAPLPIRLPIAVKDTLALGAELSNVICAAKGTNAFLSQYIGETSKFETLDFAKETAQRLMLLTRLKPKIIACDLHPAYNTTLLAKELSEKYDAKLYQIQHHKAHVASVAAEHGLNDYVGIAMDGLGYGDDGDIWGGEIFDVTESVKFRRVGHLQSQPQLGGDAATMNPKKMLFGILSNILEEELMDLGLFENEESKVYFEMLHKKFNTPMTTSAGRILDAVAALLDICDSRTYDGRPAMLLEACATTPVNIEPVIINHEGKKILSTNALFEFLLEKKDSGKYSKGELAATAQMYLARGVLEIAQDAARELKKPIVFSGGVAYNRMITGYMLKNGVLINKEIPSGDGGICYGQAYLANIINKIDGDV